MEIFENNDFCIITPLSQRIDNYQTSRIIGSINDYPNHRIGIDMKYVEDCTIDFFDELGKFPEVSLFNIESNIFALLNILNLDKRLNLFVTLPDFLNNKHRILCRNLKLVS